jgi:lysophospholipase L1-like esterase
MSVIVALGDSTTAGTPFFESPLEVPPDGRGNPEGQYAHWLMAAHPDWQVLNRGVNGERSDQIAARFHRDVLQARPDVVVILGGVNDVYQHRPVAEVIGHLQTMYRHAATHQIPVVAATIVPYNSATPVQNGAMRAINEWILSRPALDRNVAVADTRGAAASHEDPDRLAGSADGLHPDIDGYRRMAQAIEPVLARLLRGGGLP